VPSEYNDSSEENAVPSPTLRCGWNNSCRDIQRWRSCLCSMEHQHNDSHRLRKGSHSATQVVGKIWIVIDWSTVMSMSFKSLTTGPVMGYLCAAFLWHVEITIGYPTSSERSCSRAPGQSASVHLGSACQHLGNKKSLGLAAVAWQDGRESLVNCAGH
jgi:hypothetical protein